jgi:hypothetical protein
VVKRRGGEGPRIPDDYGDRAMPTWLPLLPFVLIVGSGAWVYHDAIRLDREHSPVVLHSQLVNLDSPQDWTIACIVGWIIFFPLYLTGRRHDV